MIHAHETPRIASNILPFIRSPANSREAFDLAEWTTQNMLACFAAGQFFSVLCAHNLRLLADTLDCRARQ